MNEQKLDSLLASYRDACPGADSPELEGSKNFMPELWRRIEERRRSETWLFRWANAFAAAAAIVAITTGVIFYQSPKPLPQRAYIEKLTDEINEDYFLTNTYMRTASYSLPADR
jgi:hypothetical protein